MTGENKKSLKKLICTGMVILALVGCVTAPAAIVTSTYEFLPEQSTLVQTGGMSGHSTTYSVEGQFQLTVDFDAGIGSFDQVNATYGDGYSIGDLFNMTELVGTVVSDMVIDFEGQTREFGFDIHLGLTFMNDSLHLTGGFVESLPDGCAYDLDAIAVPEPVTVCLLALGGLALLRKQRASRAEM